MPFNKDNEWIPTKKQSQLLSVPFTIREALIGGGAGFGKSELLLAFPLVFKWHENPRFKQVFMRRTFPELKREIVPRSQEMYLRFGARFSNADMVWVFPRPDQYGSGRLANDGARVFLGHCETDVDVHKYDSMEINLFTPDEITSFTEYIYLYIGFTRVRTSDPDLPAIIRAAGMPGDIGHTWVKKRFVDPYPEGGKILVGRGGNKRIYIHATLADNPHIDAGYRQSLEGLPEAEKQAKLYGSWDAYLGQVFEEFRDKNYPDEPPNACHVIEPFDIPEWWPRLVSIDWGFTPPAMTCVLYGAISPEKRLIIYREQAWQKTKIEDWAPYVKEFIHREKPRSIKLCRSAGQERGLEHTVYSQIASALDYNVDLTDNSSGSRVAGKQLIHEYLRWKEKYRPERPISEYDDNHAAWLMRNRGMVEYQKYLDGFKPDERETNLPKLLIFSTCPLVSTAIKACSYNKNRPEDVAEFPGDDPYDALRYITDEADRYFVEAENEFKKIQSYNKIVQGLTDTGNWNAYYNQMRRVEANDWSRGKPIKRFHKRRHFHA